MSDEQLERDVALVDFAMRLESHEFRSAWQRLKPRLTPDRERVARALAREWLGEAHGEFEFCELPESAKAGFLASADVAIDAMKEAP